MNEVVSPATLEALGRLGTAALCNAIEEPALRLRNEGFMDASVLSRVTASVPMVGFALTVRMRTDAPPAGGLSYPDRSDWWEAFGAGPLPKVVVIEDVGRAPGQGAVAGETHMRIFKALGAKGLVTNGAVRDIAALRALGLPVYSSGVVPSHAYAHIVSVGEPVTVGGLSVSTGDLLHGDLDGIVNVPAQIASDLARIADRQRVEEDTIFAICEEPAFSSARLRAALSALATMREN